VQVRYGLVTKIDCTPDSLAALAYLSQPDRHFTNCLDEIDPPKPARKGCDDPIEYPDLLINPSQYLLGLRAIPANQLLPLNSPLTPIPVPYHLPVVFFGSGYGEDDTYSTPLGTMYGVEIHAAAFMSLLNPASEHTKLLGFAVEIVFALLLGGGISWCWRRYYGMRFSSDAWRRQASPYLIVLLGLALIIVVTGATYLSFLLLSHTNYWLSPIPIAIGMIVESLFNGAVHEAVHEGNEQRQSLLHRLDDAYRVSVAHFNKTLAHEKRERPREVHHLNERLRRFAFLDVQRLYHKRKYFAVFLLIVRRLLFLSLLVLGLYAIFKH
jgi:CHASE2 domain